MTPFLREYKHSPSKLSTPGLVEIAVSQRNELSKAVSIVGRLQPCLYYGGRGV